MIWFHLYFLKIVCVCERERERWLCMNVGAHRGRSHGLELEEFVLGTKWVFWKSSYSQLLNYWTISPAPLFVANLYFFLRQTNKQFNSRAVVAHVLNHSTWEAEASGFKASLVYTLSSRPVKAILRIPVLKSYIYISFVDLYLLYFTRRSVLPACIYICITCMPVPMEARRGCQILWNCNRLMWSTMRMLVTNFRSSAKATHALHCQT